MVVTDRYDARGRLLDESDDAYPTRTPAPWTLDEGDVRALDGVVIAMIAPGAKPGDEHLIAAAPDLLNALARMIVNCPVCSREVRFIEGVTADGLRCPNCYGARAVLERATGGDR
jgi:hypothetical protein